MNFLLVKVFISLWIAQIDVHTPEDSENIALLINSTLSLAQSSSQIKPERKIEILREILNLSAPTVYYGFFLYQLTETNPSSSSIELLNRLILQLGPRILC